MMQDRLGPVARLFGEGAVVRRLRHVERVKDFCLDKVGK
jgi:hypothetical protein